MDASAKGKQREQLSAALDSLARRGAERQAEERTRESARREWIELRDSFIAAGHFTLDGATEGEFVRRWAPLWLRAAILARGRLGMTSCELVSELHDVKYEVARTLFDLALSKPTEKDFARTLAKAVDTALEANEFYMLRDMFRPLTDYAWHHYAAQFSDLPAAEPCIPKSASDQEASESSQASATADSPVSVSTPTSTDSSPGWQRIGDVLVALAHRAARDEAAKADVAIQAAPDFTWLRVGSQTYKFKKGNQSETIRVLYEQWTRSGRTDGCGLGEAAIGAAIGSSAGAFRVLITFRKHPALRTILKQAGKGYWALYLAIPPTR